MAEKKPLLICETHLHFTPKKLIEELQPKLTNDESKCTFCEAKRMLEGDDSSISRAYQCLLNAGVKNPYVGFPIVFKGEKVSESMYSKLRQFLLPEKHYAPH